MKMKEISTKGMSREEWLSHRRKAIGGSDAAAIVGLNPYSSVYEVWADKMGLLPPKEENEAMRIGHDLEEYVARRFTEATRKKVRRKNAILYSDKVPFAHANVDRLVVGEDAGLECKTTSVMNLKKFHDGEFPPHYYVQCQHYMMVTGIQTWYLAVLVLGKEFLWFEIKRNEEDIAALKAAESRLWQCVMDKRAPETDGSMSCTDAVNAIFPEAMEGVEADLTAVRKMVQLREDLSKQIVELETLKREQENAIKDFMGDAESGTCDGYCISWKNASRRTFDAKRFFEDHPEIDVSGYMKTTKYRTFKVRNMEE